MKTLSKADHTMSYTIVSTSHIGDIELNEAVVDPLLTEGAQ